MKDRLSKLLVRPERSRSRGLTISDCSGLEDAINKEIIGTPGGLVLEIYFIFDLLRILGEREDMPKITLRVDNVKMLLRPFIENWFSNEISFEIGLKPETYQILEEMKVDLFGEELEVTDFNDIYGLVAKLPEENRDEKLRKVIDVLSRNISFFFLKESGGLNIEEVSEDESKSSTFKTDNLLNKLPDMVNDSQVSKEIPEATFNEASKENAVLGSMSKDEVTVQPGSVAEEAEDTIFTDE